MADPNDIGFVIDSSTHVEGHCVPVDLLWWTFLEDIFVPLTFFILAFIDYKLVKICYYPIERNGAQREEDKCAWHIKMITLGLIFFSLQISINYTSFILREQAISGKT